MTSSEFTTWLKGFAAAKRDSHVTAADWQLIVEELNQIEVPSDIPYLPGYPGGVASHTEVPIFNNYTSTEERIL